MFPPRMEGSELYRVSPTALMESVGETRGKGEMGEGVERKEGRRGGGKEYTVCV